MDTLFKTEADKSFGCTSVWLGGGCHCLVAGWRSCQNNLYTSKQHLLLPPAVICSSVSENELSESVEDDGFCCCVLRWGAGMIWVKGTLWFSSHCWLFPWLWQRLHLCSHLSHNFASRPILGAQHKLFHYKISTSLSHLFCGYSSKLGGYRLFWSPSLVSFLFSELDVNPLLFVSSSYR